MMTIVPFSQRCDTGQYTMTEPTQHPNHERLNAWIDDEVDATESAYLAEHVASCTECAHEVHRLRALKLALACLRVDAAPRSFRLTAEQANRPSPRRMVTPSDASPSMLRALPIVRSLSIAAVLAFLVLAGSIAFGPWDTTAPGNQNPTTVVTSETGQAPTADRSDVEAQGEAASGIEGASDIQRQEERSPVQAMDDSRGDQTPGFLWGAAIVMGIVSLLLLAALAWTLYQVRIGSAR